MKKPTQVRFIVPWRFHRKGDVITPPGMLRGWLVEQGFCEIVRPTDDVEIATVGPTENAALRVDPPKRKRGRPRKIRTAVT